MYFCPNSSANFPIVIMSELPLTVTDLGLLVREGDAFEVIIDFEVTARAASSAETLAPSA